MTTTPPPPQSAARHTSVLLAQMHAREKESMLRTRMGHSLACAAAFGACWYFLVQPLERTYAQRILSKQQLQDKISAFNASPLAGENIQGTAADIDRQLDAMTLWTQPSSSPSELYDALNQLAATHNVRIDRIEPTAVQAVSPTSRAGPAAQATPRRGRRAQAAQTDAATPTWRGETVMHRMTVQGTYEAISQFIWACDHELGASKVVSFRFAADMLPGAAADQLQASIDTTHLRLIPPTTPGVASSPVSAAVAPVTGPGAPPALLSEGAAPSDVPPPLPGPEGERK